MTSALPFSLQKALANLSIEPEEVLFAFPSSAAPDGNLGESWYLFLDSTLSLIMVTPLLDEMQLQSRFFVKAVREIEARRSFLGNLHLIFIGFEGQHLGEFVVPGLQQTLWESLLSTLEKRFPGKLKEDEELLKQRLGDQTDPETGLPSILSTAQNFGGNLSAMSDGRISVTGGPRIGSADLSVHSSRDFDHRASAAQIVSGPSLLTPIKAVEVDPIGISKGMSIAGLDQSMLSSSQNFDQPISIEVEDRSGNINLPDIAMGNTPPGSPTSDYSALSLGLNPDRSTAPEAPPPSGKKKKYKKHQEQKEVVADGEAEYRCPSCGRQNRADYFYCLGCGAQLLKLPKEESVPASPPPPSSTSSRPGKRMTPKVSFGASTAQEHSGEGVISGCLSQLFMIVVMMIAIFILLGIFS